MPLIGEKPRLAYASRKPPAVQSIRVAAPSVPMRPWICRRPRPLGHIQCPMRIVRGKRPRPDHPRLYQRRPNATSRLGGRRPCIAIPARRLFDETYNLDFFQAARCSRVWNSGEAELGAKSPPKKTTVAEADLYNRHRPFPVPIRLLWAVDRFAGSTAATHVLVDIFA